MFASEFTNVMIEIKILLSTNYFFKIAERRNKRTTGCNAMQYQIPGNMAFNLWLST
jgi:hypothetical protein